MLAIYLCIGTNEFSGARIFIGVEGKHDSRCGVQDDLSWG